jgi:hypothetical protein
VGKTSAQPSDRAPQVFSSGYDLARQIYLALPQTAKLALFQTAINKKKVVKAGALDKEAPDLGDKVLAGELKLSEANKEAEERKAAAEPAGVASDSASTEPASGIQWVQSRKAARVIIPLPPDLPALAEILYVKLGKKRALKLETELLARLKPQRE